MPTYNSINDYTGDGSTATYAVNFTGGFIERSHVNIYLDTVETLAFTWDTDSQITFDAAPANGVAIRIQRNTPLTALVDFVNTALLTEEDLDLLVTQTIFLNQESRDIQTDDLDTAVTAAQTAQGLAETAQTASEAARDASVTAQGLSEDARDASIVAQSASESARDASIVAQGLAEAAQLAAETAEANAEAAEASVISAISTHAAITSGVHGISAFGATLVDDVDAATARGTLGFTGPILDKASPGPIGSVSPNTGAFSSLITENTSAGAQGPASILRNNSNTVGTEGIIGWRTNGAVGNNDAEIIFTRETDAGANTSIAFEQKTSTSGGALVQTFLMDGDGNPSFSGALIFDTSTVLNNGQCGMFRDATYGTTISGFAGTTGNMQIRNSGGSLVMHVPNNTQDATFAGTVQAATFKVAAGTGISATVNNPTQLIINGGIIIGAS